MNPKNLKLSNSKTLSIFSDGGARGNPGPAAIGFLVRDNTGKTLITKGKFIGHATNNVAEYQALIEVLKWLVDFQKTAHRPPFTAHCFLDSQLIVKQLNGFYKIKNAKLRNLAIQVRGLENQIKGSIIYQHIPREKNKEADRLLNQALDQHLLVPYFRKR